MCQLAPLIVLISEAPSPAFLRDCLLSWEQETQDDGYPLHVPPKNDYSKSSTTLIARLGSEAVSNAFAPSSNLNVWVIIWVTCEVLFVRL